MKPTDFELYRYVLPFCEPLVLGGTTLRHREGVLLRLVGDNGAEGWGEASPLPGFSRESVAGAAGELRRLAASMRGREVGDGWIGADGDLARELDRLALAPSVRFGFETAAWSLYGAAQGETLPGVISTYPRAIVPVNGLLTGSPAEALEEARRLRDAGYLSVKLKVGGRPVEEDITLVHAVKQTLGEGVSLRLDANRAWSLEEGVRFAGGVSGVSIEYVEEPLADPVGLRDFARYCGIPVALDESLVGMAPERLEDHRYAVAVVIKPTLLGGISRALRMADRASVLGIGSIMSSAYETGVGTTALVALAAGIGDAAVPAGLDTYRRLAQDVLEPRLALPAPRLDVREVVESGRGVVHRRLLPIGPPR